MFRLPAAANGVKSVLVDVRELALILQGIELPYGAEWNAIATSLIASCKLQDIEPWAYLRDVLTLLPSWPKHAALELAPKLWNQTRQQPQTQQRLAAARLLGRFDDVHAPESRLTDQAAH